MPGDLSNDYGAYHSLNIYYLTCITIKNLYLAKILPQMLFLNDRARF